MESVGKYSLDLFSKKYDWADDDYEIEDNASIVAATSTGAEGDRNEGESHYTSDRAGLEMGLERQHMEKNDVSYEAGDFEEEGSFDQYNREDSRGGIRIKGSSNPGGKLYGRRGSEYTEYSGRGRQGRGGYTRKNATERADKSWQHSRRYGKKEYSDKPGYGYRVDDNKGVRTGIGEDRVSGGTRQRYNARRGEETGRYAGYSKRRSESYRSDGILECDRVEKWGHDLFRGYSQNKDESNENNFKTPKYRIDMKESIDTDSIHGKVNRAVPEKRADARNVRKNLRENQNRTEDTINQKGDAHYFESLDGLTDQDSGALQRAAGNSAQSEKGKIKKKVEEDAVIDSPDQEFLLPDESTAVHTQDTALPNEADIAAWEEEWNSFCRAGGLEKRVSKAFDGKNGVDAPIASKKPYQYEREVRAGDENTPGVDTDSLINEGYHIIDSPDDSKSTSSSRAFDAYSPGLQNLSPPTGSYQSYVGIEQKKHYSAVGSASGKGKTSAMSVPGAPKNNTVSHRLHSDVAYIDGYGEEDDNYVNVLEVPGPSIKPHSGTSAPSIGKGTPSTYLAPHDVQSLDTNTRGSHLFTLVVPVSKNISAPLHVCMNDDLDVLVCDFDNLWHLQNTVKSILLDTLLQHRTLALRLRH
ncbi:hypothetical protein AX774_g1184 [Zancudomyces culisetae]|uniref:Uncharacterized protein n=1 Tax=Zancudomyces culisetae TaxID=1213189 RepID=A0A1R1PWF1_ZANCU|nr:hypothetical protein AX774_g1184 [Zancudomyces culisetae]|eukprot:OMH85259.1 hypothetical protein AX774_g1184 [Zancudomyces culisetae]